jgi:hypothetical protein
MPAGDSFTFILAAASEKPVLLQSSTGATAEKEPESGTHAQESNSKEQQGRAADVKQTEAVTVSSPSSRHEASAMKSSDHQPNLKVAVAGSSTVSAGLKWSVPPNEMGLRSNTSLLANQPACATPQIAPLTAWTSSTVQLPKSGVTVQTAVTAKLNLSDTEKRPSETATQSSAPPQAIPQHRTESESGIAGRPASIAQPLTVNETGLQPLSSGMTGQLVTETWPALSEKFVSTPSEPSAKSVAVTSTAQAVQPEATAVGKPQPYSVGSNGITADTVPMTQPSSASEPDSQEQPSGLGVPPTTDVSSTTSTRTATFAPIKGEQNTSESQALPTSVHAATPQRNATLPDQGVLAAPQNARVNADFNTPAEPIALTGLVTGGFQGSAGMMPDPSMALATSLPDAVQGSGVETANNEVKKTDPKTVSAKDSDFAGAMNAAPHKAEADANSATEAPVHGAQSTQTDSVQGSQPATHSVEIAPAHAEAQVASSHVTATQAQATPLDAVVSKAPSQAAPQSHEMANIDSESGKAIAELGLSAARLMQSVTGSEMRIGLNSAEFGDISIRTTISNHQMVAQISLDHSELSQSISAHAFSMQDKLGKEYGLDASIEVNAFASAHTGESGDSSHRERGSSRGNVGAVEMGSSAEDGNGLSLEPASSVDSDTRLDIRA